VGSQRLTAWAMALTTNILFIFPIHSTRYEVSLHHYRKAAGAWILPFTSIYCRTQKQWRYTSPPLPQMSSWHGASLIGQRGNFSFTYRVVLVHKVRNYLFDWCH
jgi:hypothetical protein